MQLRAWMEQNGMSLTAVLNELKRLAPEQTKSMVLSTVSRHASGAVIPGQPMQHLYMQLTGGAVTPFDWSALWNAPESVAARTKEAEIRQKRKEVAA